MLKSKFVVTCVSHGDTCDGHVTKLGVAGSPEAAEAIIKDNMQLFIESYDGAHEQDFDMSSFHEIWYDDQNGRVYDVIEV